MLSSTPLFTITILNLFWILYLLPGFAVYSIFRKRMFSKMDGDYLGRKIVYSFYLSTMFLLPIAIFAFFFTIPFWLGGSYLLLLIALGGLFFFKTNFSLISFKDFPQKIKKNLTVTSVLVTIAIFFDFLLSTWAKGFIAFGGDVWVHLAKINHNIHNGFSIVDPYFIDGSKEIIQSTHPSNISHIVLSLAGGILNISALDVWAYSGSFFRIIAFTTIYVLARELTKNKYLSILIAGLFYLTQLKGEALLTILYPANQAFFATIFLLLVMLNIIKTTPTLNKINYVLYIFGIVLVSFTHQIQFSLIALFLTGFFVLLFFLKEIDFKRLVFLVVPFVLGLPTALFSLKETKFITDSVININKDMLHYFPGGFYALGFPEKTLTVATLISFVGLIFVSQYIKNSKYRTLLFYAVIFDIVLLYTPFFMIVNKVIPVWGIQRYEYLNNIFIIILVSLALWFLINLVLEKEVKKSNQVLVVVAILGLISLPYQTDTKNFSFWKRKNAETYKTMQEFNKLCDYIKPGSVVMAEKWVSFFEPALCNSYVVGLDSTRTTNTIPTKKREVDTDSFFFSKDLSQKERRALVGEYNIKDIIILNSNLNLVKPEALGFTRVAEIKDHYLYEKQD